MPAKMMLPITASAMPPETKLKTVLSRPTMPQFDASLSSEPVALQSDLASGVSGILFDELFVVPPEVVVAPEQVVVDGSQVPPSVRQVVAALSQASAEPHNADAFRVKKVLLSDINSAKVRATRSRFPMCQIFLLMLCVFMTILSHNLPLFAPQIKIGGAPMSV